MQGIGSDLNNTDAINGRARKKSISNAVTLGIIDAVKDKGETQRLQTYWNTYYCQSTVTTANGKLYGNYCKNRHCTLCASIRKAEIINQYLPIIEKWSEPYFVTLTSKSVPAYLLNRNIKGCFRAFRKIKERFRKRFERGKIDFKLMGIKSLECNFNPKLKTYNPHFHIIVPDKKTAEALIQEWMKIWTPKHTGIGGQHMVKITNPAKCMVEVIKYGSKIFTEPDPRNKSKKNKVRDIYVVALDNIYKAMKGKRIFERFGFNLGENKKKRKPKTSALTKFETWTFEAQTGNWINNKNGNSLSSYVIPHDLEDLLKNNINLDLE
ncbi:MAG: protein rep [Crocinitomicaceae bacterium]|nr:protein rep [Crocinitomicaceae bacterium]